MRLMLSGLAVLLAACAVAEPAMGDGFTIDQWSLGTGVYISYTGQSASAGSGVVQNPYSETFFIPLGNSYSSTTHEYSWSEPDGVGSFLMDIDQRAEGVPSGASPNHAGTDNRMWFTAEEDLWMTIDGVFSYHLPVDLMTAAFEVRVGYDAHPGNLFIGGGEVITFPVAPISGDLTASGQFLVPAGETYFLSTRAYVRTSLNTLGHFATGSGYVNVSLAPVPEPTTLSFLAIPILALIRRPRR